MTRWNQTIATASLILLTLGTPGCRGCDSSDEGSNGPVEAGHPIDQCGRALGAIAKLPPDQMNLWPDLYGFGCAGLYRQPRCRAAWLVRSDASPPERTRAVILACADDYCPIVEQPAPALCTMDRSAVDAVRLTEMWPELHALILSRELQVAPDSGAVEALNRLFVPVTIPVERPADAAAQLPSTVIRMQLADGKVEVTIGMDGGDRKWMLPTAPVEPDLKELKQEFVRQAPTPESRAVIESTGEVPYGAVMKVLEVAKEAGYTRIALSVSRL